MEVRTEYVVCDLCGSDQYRLLFCARDTHTHLVHRQFPLVQCKRCGLVFVNPRPTREELEKLYPPAEYYSWPHKINDYLSAGRATVINPVGDIARLFQENTVGALAPYDPDGFAACLAKLLLDRDRCAEYGAQARQVMVEQFDWRVLGERIEQAVVGS